MEYNEAIWPENTWIYYRQNRQFRMYVAENALEGSIAATPVTDTFFHKLLAQKQAAVRCGGSGPLPPSCWLPSLGATDPKGVRK